MCARAENEARKENGTMNEWDYGGVVLNNGKRKQKETNKQTQNFL